MIADEIRIGERYIAKVSGKLTTVRVDAIRTRYSYSGDTHRRVFDVTNLATGRRTTFRSASKFRSVAAVRTTGSDTKPCEGEA